MSVNYDKLVVTGVSYLSVLKLDIAQRVNCHAYASVELEVDREEGEVYMKEVHENEAVTVGIPEVIFLGLIQSASIRYEDAYAVLKLELVSTSILWDLQKRNKSYQRIGESYSQIMRRAADGEGVIDFCGTDPASETVIVQYQETVWEFILRLASVCREPVYVDPTARAPHIIVGNGKAPGVQGGSKTGTNGEAGRADGYISLGGKTEGGMQVGGTKSRMEHGELITAYEGLPGDALIPEQKPPKFAGRVMGGIVQAVDRDMVQVHIVDLDSEYDGGSNTWFKYSTLYSSAANEAGIYCMPIAGDPIRVFFPSENLSEAFASSSATVRGIVADPKEKCFSTPDGMTVLFGEEGLMVFCGKKKVEIRLYKDGTVSLASEKPIGIHAKENIRMKANEGNICVQSDEKICMVTGHSMISMTRDQTIAVSDRIITQ